MRRRPAHRHALIFLTSLVVFIPSSGARAQSLFNNRGASNPGQTARPTGSLFSGSAGFPGNTRFGTTNAASETQPAGSSRSFVGRSNRSFVGSRASNATTSGGDDRGVRSSASPRRSSATNENQSEPSSASRQRGTGLSGGRRSTIIPRRRIAFAFPARENEAIRNGLQIQIANLAATHPDFNRIQVHVDATGLATLSGQVPSENTRTLVAIMVRLEPGVRDVQNRLSVEAGRE